MTPPPGGSHQPLSARSGSSSTSTTRRMSTGLRILERLLHPPLPCGGPGGRGSRGRQRLRVGALRAGDHVQRCVSFWLKSQPYSLRDMLAGDPSTDSFVLGTVYQAFLSGTNYHRWHSPVAGTIVRAWSYPAPTTPSPTRRAARPATRRRHRPTRRTSTAVFIIDADDPVHGLVAFVPVGMSEVSSCVIDPTVTTGRHVDKGDDWATSSSKVLPTAWCSCRARSMPSPCQRPRGRKERQPRWSWSAARTPARPPAVKLQQTTGRGSASHSR